MALPLMLGGSSSRMFLQKLDQEYTTKISENIWIYRKTDINHGHDIVFMRFKHSVWQIIETV